MNQSKQTGLESRASLGKWARSLVGTVVPMRPLRAFCFSGHQVCGHLLEQTQKANTVMFPLNDLANYSLTALLINMSGTYRNPGFPKMFAIM